MQKKFEFSFGNVSLIEFPAEAKRFNDFPDGRIIIGDILKDNTPLTLQKSIKNGDVLYYQVNVKQANARKGITAASAYEEVSSTLMPYLNARYLSEGKQVIGGVKSMLKVIEWNLNPSRVNKTQGTVQLIHGVSSASSDQGTNNFELYFPRGMRFQMAGYTESINERFTKFDSYNGVVEFANKSYCFQLRGNSNAWNPTVVDRPTSLQEAEVLFSKTKRINDIMKESTASVLIREHIYTLFPFIHDYGMLGELCFHPTLTPAEEAVRWDNRENW